MKRPFNKWSFIAAGLYFVGVVVAIASAFDFEGRTNTTAWEIVMVLTIPLSAVSFLFLWAISHGAGLEYFAAMYGIFGLINAWLLYLLFKTLRSKS